MHDQCGLVAPHDAAIGVEQKQPIRHGIGDLFALRDLGVAVFQLLFAVFEFAAQQSHHVIKRALRALRLAQQFTR